MSDERAGFRDRLQATLGSAFTLEHELSGGAMSRVFSATETALGRRVVVKVLSPELAEGVSADRFAREIRFAASLQQANIVPVLATGDTHGLPFYTMPFVDGLSLREKLRRDGALSIPEAIGVLRDVSRALAYAHERGVVHRDIKPENVLLSGDAAVVTDFGIAKAISVARTTTLDERGGTSLTRAGIAIGTPAYMAPEQVSGDDTADHRADLYSLGCVAYELLTGAPPFGGRNVRELFGAHLAEAPVPLAAKRPECPSAIAQLVMQCLEKDPARRPQSARAILATLDSAALRRSSQRLRMFPARARWVAAAMATIAVAAVVAFVARRQSPSPATVQTLAVLPFAAIGGDSAQSYLADGISDELATALGKTQGIRVVGRTAAYRFQGQRDVDARSVGRTLGADLVLQGSVRRANDRLRVSAQLTSAQTGEELWSEGYERVARDVLGVQNDVTRAIVAAMRERFGRRIQASADTSRGTSDPEAYDLYLRGQYLLRRRGPGVQQAAENFERALERDPKFARAHAGLSAALELYPYFAATPAADVYDRATAAASRALALDSTQSEAHTALAMAYQHAYDWKRAGEAHERAVGLDPSDASAHHQYGRYLLYTAQLDSALAEFQRAKEIDPFSALYSGWIAWTLWYMDRRPQALSEIRRALEIDSLNAPALQIGVRILYVMGDTATAKRSVRYLPTYPPWSGIDANVRATMGDRETAARVVREMERQSPRPWMSELVIAYASLARGDTTRALNALEAATAKGEIWPSFMPLVDEMYDAVRPSARFANLVRRVGLDDRIYSQPKGGRR
jgi:serine/threonine-protein kinase